MDSHKSDFSTGDEKIIGSQRPITFHGTGRVEQVPMDPKCAARMGGIPTLARMIDPIRVNIRLGSWEDVKNAAEITMGNGSTLKTSAFRNALQHEDAHFRRPRHLDSILAGELQHRHVGTPSRYIDLATAILNADPMVHSDQMTSRVSNFLYTAQECNAFVTILQAAEVTSGYHNLQYGEWTYHQVLLDLEHPGLSDFETSEKHRAHLDDAFIDHVVYGHEWERLTGDCNRAVRTRKPAAVHGPVACRPA
ncbi:hypothetical protein DFH09DRAFT_1396590 [Mycena vulgaris]|nr:hypothetical protein DFH09DRAFT_1396590 [Mycena vulgaris]